MEKDIAIYDNMGETFDRITIVFNDTKMNTNYGIAYDALGCSETGIGFFTHTTAMKGRHLGKKITFSDLHSDLQNRLISYFKNDK